MRRRPGRGADIAASSSVDKCPNAVRSSLCRLMSLFTESDVVVPAVTSCSSTMSLSDVKIVTSMLRASAFKSAERMDGEVILGV